MRGSQRRFCASVPNLISTGPSIDSPKGTMRGVCASAHSVSKMNDCTALQPVPPYSFGQWLASQPRAFRIACHSSWSAFFRRMPRCTLSARRCG